MWIKNSEHVLVVDGNEVYELDEECLEEKRKEVKG